MARLHRFLEKLRAPVATDEGHRTERVLAVARAFLASSSLLAIYLDPTQPSRYVALAYGLLVAYLAGSLLVLGALQLRREVGRAAQSIIHGVDVVCAALLTLFTEGPSSPFFAFFVFVLVAAAFRWGFRQALATAGTIVVLLFVEAVLLSPGSGVTRRLLEGEFELNRFVIRAAYLAILGFLLGYVANEEKQRRAEASAIARTSGKVQAETGLKGTLEAVANEVLGLLGGDPILLAIEELGNRRVFLWEARRVAGAPEGNETTLQVSELEFARRETYLFPVASHSWLAVRKRWPNGGAPFHVVGLDSEGRRAAGFSFRVPDSLLASHPSRALYGVSVTLGDDWSGRVLVVDPKTPGVRGLRLLQALVRQLAPAVYSVHLARRLRSQAGAIERARVARELHDGVIQALVGLEMQVDVLRRRAEAESVPLAADLTGIQRHLRDEVLDVRELMQQMKPLDLRPNQLLEFLAEQADRFSRETGISTRFISDRDEVALAPRVCREVARIVQEALVNVRKHSGARNAVVRLSAQNGHWLLVIDDDGRGFDFAGRWTQDELDIGRRGPLVIKERVRAIRGRLTIESRPGRGARLEIDLPHFPHRSQT